MNEKPPAVLLTCYCCGERYERGHWVCCAPPKDFSGREWLEQFCTACADPNKRKCPKHCNCEKPQTEGAHDEPDTWTPFSGVRMDLAKGWK